jgi:hypothetical protein
MVPPPAGCVIEQERVAFAEYTDVPPAARVLGVDLVESTTILNQSLSVTPTQIFIGSFLLELSRRTIHRTAVPGQALG